MNISLNNGGFPTATSKVKMSRNKIAFQFKPLNTEKFGNNVHTLTNTAIPTKGYKTIYKCFYLWPCLRGIDRLLLGGTGRLSAESILGWQVRMIPSTLSLPSSIHTHTHNTHVIIHLLSNISMLLCESNLEKAENVTKEPPAHRFRSLSKREGEFSHLFSTHLNFCGVPFHLEKGWASGYAMFSHHNIISQVGIWS